MTITDECIVIGYQQHATPEWREFDDRVIATMDPEALAFWKVWKEPILAMADAHQAEARRVIAERPKKEGMKS